MKAIVTTVKGGVRLFLTESGTATDIPERAAIRAYGADAHIIACNANAEKAWRNWGFHWEAANMLHNGQIA